MVQPSLPTMSFLKTLDVLHVHVAIEVLRQLQLARVDAVVANGTEDLLHSEAIS
jgi:hypothetical protein